MPKSGNAERAERAAEPEALVDLRVDPELGIFPKSNAGKGPHKRLRVIPKRVLFLLCRRSLEKGFDA